MKVPNLQEQNAEIRLECQRLADFLCAKNTAYGGQALAPIAIVSKGDPLDIIFARMDDKLSRILRGQAAGEDPWQDLRGYITLWQVVIALKKKGFYDQSTPPVGNTSAMPMPIADRYAGGEASTEMTFDDFDADHGDGTPETVHMTVHESDDPTDMSVPDLNAIANQTVASLQPKVPETFQEVANPEKGSTVGGEDDPWAALQRPTRKKNGGTTSLSPDPIV